MFGEKRFQKVGKAFGAAIGQGVCVGPAKIDGYCAPHQCDNGIRRIPHARVEDDWHRARRRHDAGQELERRDFRIRLLSENNRVTTLNLLSNKIGDDGVKSLSTALMNETTK